MHEGSFKQPTAMLDCDKSQVKSENKLRGFFNHSSQISSKVVSFTKFLSKKKRVKAHSCSLVRCCCICVSNVWHCGKERFYACECVATCHREFIHWNQYRSCFGIDFARNLWKSPISTVPPLLSDIKNNCGKECVVWLVGMSKHG